MPGKATLSSGTGEGAPVSCATPLRVAMLSIHSSPLGELGTEDTGGMSVYISELSSELGRAGHSVDIYTCANGHGGAREVALSEGVRLVHLSIDSNRRLTKASLVERLPEVSDALEGHLREEGLSYDLLHSHYWLSAWVGQRVRRSRGIPHVMTFHTTGLAKRVLCAHEREPSFRLLAERRLALAGDRVLASTETEKQSLVKYCGVPPDRVGIVPCGVNLERFRPLDRDSARRKLGLDDAGAVVLYVGRFAPVKGIDRLLTAAAHLRGRPGLKVVIVGGDGGRTDVAARLKRFSLKSGISDFVLFRGRVRHEELPFYYNAADVLVVPSHYETFGLVALESLACGTPVVATPVGAMAGLIREGATGTLVEAPSPRYLAAAIERSIGPEGRPTLSRSEIRASVLGYGWAGVATRIAGEYAALIRPQSVAL